MGDFVLCEIWKYIVLLTSLIGQTGGYYGLWTCLLFYVPICISHDVDTRIELTLKLVNIFVLMTLAPRYSAYQPVLGSDTLHLSEINKLIRPKHVQT